MLAAVYKVGVWWRPPTLPNPWRMIIAKFRMLEGPGYGRVPRKHVANGLAVTLKTGWSDRLFLSKARQARGNDLAATRTKKS